VDLVLPSAAVGLAKPAPELYRLACRRAGVEPHAAAMIGDSYQADALAARAAGMHAVLLDRDGVARDVNPAVPVATDLVTAVDLARGLLGIPPTHHVP
jgi:putative hydrolase of the HAD superfamily